MNNSNNNNSKSAVNLYMNHCLLSTNSLERSRKQIDQQVHYQTLYGFPQIKK